jgi:hypothetical protein
VTLRPYNELNGKLVLDTIDHVLSSHQQIDLEAGDFNISIGTLSIPSGAGRKKYPGPESAKTKQSMTHVTGNSVTCLAESIAVGFAKNSIVAKTSARRCRETNNDLLIRTGECTMSHFNHVRDSTTNERYTLSSKLCELAGVSKTGVLSIADIPKFKSILKKSNCSNIGRMRHASRVPRGCRLQKASIRPSWQNRDDTFHFECISDIVAFYGKGNYCHSCQVPFEKGQYKCDSYCNLCEKEECKPGIEKFCPDCNFFFKSANCFKLHKTPAPSKNYKGKNKNKAKKLTRCDKVKKCPDCKKILLYKVRSIKEHRY